MCNHKNNMVLAMCDCSGCTIYAELYAWDFRGSLSRRTKYLQTVCMYIILHSIGSFKSVIVVYIYQEEENNGLNA